MNGSMMEHLVREKIQFAICYHHSRDSVPELFITLDTYTSSPVPPSFHYTTRNEKEETFFIIIKHGLFATRIARIAVISTRTETLGFVSSFWSCPDRKARISITQSPFPLAPKSINSFAYLDRFSRRRDTFLM